MNPGRNVGWILLAVLGGPSVFVAGAADETKPNAFSKRKVLVELYTSQGCNSCPAAEKVFGDLERLGVDRSRVVPVAFHVDYFDKPWKDPYSNPTFSRREYQYSLVYQKQKKIADPNYLYFTPMMMIDGRHPMLGSNEAEARKSLAKALAEKPAAVVTATWSGDVGDASRTLKVRVEGRSAELKGQALIVGAALTENPVSTKVATGENGGKTLVEHHVARRFDAKEAKLARGESASFEFAMPRPQGVPLEKLAAVVFVQNTADGRIHQAESIPWTSSPPANP